LNEPLKPYKDPAKSFLVLIREHVVIKVIQETAHSIYDPRLGFVLFGLDEKDKDRHLVVEITFEQLAEQVFFRQKMLVLRVMNCRPVLLTRSFFDIDYF